MIAGMMMDAPLTITSIMRHAMRVFPDQEIVSVTADRPVLRYRYRDAFDRVAQLANALVGLGVESGDCIATIACNDHRHFETYYAISCLGAICHTINPRLYSDQISYIINHSEDKFVLIDPLFLPVLENVSEELKTVRGVIVLCDKEAMPETSLDNVYCYEDIIAGQSATYDWPDLDESTASALCYTSGTTGNPKGVLYSHRSTLLMSYASVMPDAINLSSKSCVLAMVPMFHVNAWNIPYSVPMVGAKLVLPGPNMLDAEGLFNLIDSEQTTMGSGVPVIWNNLLQYLRENNKTMTSMETVFMGGSAPSISLIRALEKEHDVKVEQGWGMTEMSTLGTLNKWEPEEGEEDRDEMRLKAGRPLFGVDLKIVDAQNQELPWDGEQSGALKVRGAWVADGYYGIDNRTSFDDEGWFDTGDIATIDQGYVQIVDRAKDIIKSGGEWISSVDLENVAAGHPSLAMAAVVAMPHPQWDERPLLCVVKKPGCDFDKVSMKEWFTGKVANWWIPDDCVAFDEFPMTATGKVSKKCLRDKLLETETN